MFLKTLRKPQLRFGLFVLVPILIWYFVFSFRPVFMAFRMALTDYDLLNPTNSPFVGLQHFNTIFTTYQLFWTAVRNTLVYAVGVNLGMVPLAMVFAYCLANVYRGRNFYQWALFIPVVVSMAAIALMFRFLMDPEVGPPNQLLRAVGLPTSKWLTGRTSAMYSVVLVDVWKAVGVYTVLISAGLLGIPKEIYDAAQVDGCSGWQKFWRITLPLLRRTLSLVTILVVIGSLQAYVSAIILTGGGPARATYMISQFIVEESFTNMRFGLASAASFVLFAAILIVTLLQLRFLRAEWEY